ncbi:MAG: ornithine cyclodeaminase family protein [Clostridia bacterium]|nr:ornithine cyclodeaminase family protein [Clostridia bacterium]
MGATLDGILILGPDEIRRRLPPERAVEAVAQAYIALAEGAVEAPLRTSLPPRPGFAASLAMVARGLVTVGGRERPLLSAKVVSVAPENRQAGLPTTPAALLLADAASGAPLALLDGTALTAIRTGAAGGVATRALARPEARVLALVGAGGQAWEQARAIVAVRPIEEIWVAARDPAHARAFCERWNEARSGREPEAFPAPSADDAVRRADVVSSATTAREPVFQAAALRPGTHVNGIGSFRPDMVELPPEVLAPPVFVETPEIALAESGEVRAALAAGRLSPADLVPLGEVLRGRRPGRRDEAETTVFKSCGTAAQDLFAAAWAVFA